MRYISRALTKENGAEDYNVDGELLTLKVGRNDIVKYQEEKPTPKPLTKQLLRHNGTVS